MHTRSDSGCEVSMPTELDVLIDLTQWAERLEMLLRLIAMGVWFHLGLKVYNQTFKGALKWDA